MNVAGTIILTGPACAGKTTIAKLISAHLRKPHISLDEIAGDYYRDFGFPKKTFISLESEFGYLKAYMAWEPARVFAVKRLLEQHKNKVIDFGAGHTHFLNGEYFIEVSKLLQPIKNIILLLPSNHLESSIRELRKRNQSQRKKNWIYEDYDFIRHWMTDPDNYKLAKHIVYTNGDQPNDTMLKVANLLVRK